MCPGTAPSSGLLSGSKSTRSRVGGEHGSLSGIFLLHKTGGKGGWQLNKSMQDILWQCHTVSSPPVRGGGRCDTMVFVNTLKCRISECVLTLTEAEMVLLRKYPRSTSVSVGCWVKSLCRPSLSLYKPKLQQGQKLPHTHCGGEGFTRHLVGPRTNVKADTCLGP